MSPEGRLYVKDLEDDSDVGATRIIPALARAVRWMADHCDVLVFTGDWHGLEDEEISFAPDPAAGTYPPHCMGRSDDPDERAGAELIQEVRPTGPLVLPIGGGPELAVDLADSAVRERRPVFIHKNRFDVFVGNPATDPFLEALQERLGSPPEFVVAGVARDVCVTQAVDGLQARGHTVTALSDATWGLGLEDEERTLARWRRFGTVTTVERLITGTDGR